MIRAVPVLAAALLGATVPGTRAADQPIGGPSVLVQLTALRMGSLPRVVTAYGRVETDPAARQTIMAPTSAVVGAIFVRPGQAVGEDAPLLRFGPSPATSATYSQAVSALQVARDLTRRTRSLVTQRLATAQQLAAAEKSETDARTALVALGAEGAGGPQTLRAPFRAIVTAISTSPGAIVAQGAALIDLARANAVVLRAGVVPQEADAVRSGNPVSITTVGAGADAVGSVVLRASVVDAQTGLVPVVIAPRGALLPGEMARARIVVGETRGYVVPHAAVLLDDSGVPYVVQARHGIAYRVAVKVLGSDADEDVVAGPLDSASSLVLDGNYQLTNGMRVRAASPEGRDGK